MSRCAAVVAQLALGALLALPATVLAMTVRSVQASFASPTYRISMVAVLEARPQDVEAILLDYGRYRELDPLIRSSEVLSKGDRGSAVVHTRVRFCAAFFCRTIERVEDVRPGEGELVATVDPERSELRRGVTRTTWRLENARTLVTYDAEFTPAFWVPAIIARRYAAPALQEATVTLFTNVERAANAR